MTRRGLWLALPGAILLSASPVLAGGGRDDERAPRPARAAFERRLARILRERGVLADEDVTAAFPPPGGERTELEREVDRFLAEARPGRDGRLAAAGPGPDGLETPDGRFSLRFASTFQWRYEAVDADGTAADPDGLAPPARRDGESISLRRGHVFVEGHALDPDLAYRFLVETPPSSVALLDAWVEYRGLPPARIRLGQTKVPFGREAISSSSELVFSERTRATSFFVPSRDGGAGLLVHGRALGADADLVECALGVFNGEGKNVSGNDGPGLLTIARAAVNPLGSPGYDGSDLGRGESPRLGVGAALARHDDRTGGARLGSGRGPEASHPETTLFEADAAFKWRGLSILGEWFASRVDSRDGEAAEASGGYAQAAVLLPGTDVEIGARRGLVVTRGSETFDQPRGRFSEWTAGAVWFVHGHRLEVHADWTRFRDEPSGGGGATEDVFRLQVQLTF